MTDRLASIRTVLEKVRPELMRKANVIATGIGYKRVNNQKSDELCIICSVDIKKSKASLRAADLIPASMEGVPLDVKPTGVVRALSDPRRRYRPAPGGVSIGHERVTAGTLACLVKKGNKTYILSNNHVLANSNEAVRGDAILQPGKYDGGEWPLDRIAKLSEFVAIQFDKGQSDCKIGRGSASFLNALALLLGSKTSVSALRERAAENLVDCAIAEPYEKGDVLNEILDIGTITGVAEGKLDMPVQKSGRTTGHTRGVIEQVDAVVKVNYSDTQTATFVDQLIAGPMSQGGDSGSAVLDDQNNLVGLLFAGSDEITVFNRIQNVFSALNVGLV